MSLYYTGYKRTVSTMPRHYRGIVLLNSSIAKRLPFGSFLFYGHFGSMISLVRLDVISPHPTHHLIALAAHSRTVSKLAPRYILGTAFGGDRISADSSEATDAR